MPVSILICLPSKFVLMLRVIGGRKLIVVDFAEFGCMMSEVGRGVLDMSVNKITSNIFFRFPILKFTHFIIIYSVISHYLLSYISRDLTINNTKRD